MKNIVERARASVRGGLLFKEEQQELAQALLDAVDALKFYSDEKKWEDQLAVSELGRMEISGDAVDYGEKARAVLRKLKGDDC